MNEHRTIKAAYNGICYKSGKLSPVYSTSLWLNCYNLNQKTTGKQCPCYFLAFPLISEIGNSYLNLWRRKLVIADDLGKFKVGHFLTGWRIGVKEQTRLSFRYYLPNFILKVDNLRLFTLFSLLFLNFGLHILVFGDYFHLSVWRITLRDNSKPTTTKA